MSEIDQVIRQGLSRMGVSPSAEYSVVPHVCLLTGGVPDAEIVLPSNNSFYLIAGGSFKSNLMVEAHNHIFRTKPQFSVAEMTAWAIPLLSGQVNINCATLGALDGNVTILEIKLKERENG